MNRSLFRWSVVVPIVLYAAHFAVMVLGRPTRPHWYLSELGPHEIGSGLLFLAAAVLAGHLVLRRRRVLPPKGRALIALLAVGMAFIALEELSYGQHLVGWERPAFFETRNVQKETNLHNLYGQGGQRLLSNVGEIALPVVGLILPAVFHFFSNDAYDRNHWPRYLMPRWELATPAVLSLSLRAIKDLAPVILEHKATDEFMEFIWAWAALMLVLVIRDRVKREDEPAEGSTAESAPAYSEP